ncbi:hypothetical protein MHBO_002521 [Bonamia ostreae]|uniref:Uncharacterized protein n=1 Tax=Bonamia ostreae TaxID=126728 RepID=A0ABV2AN89_9EUKA
MSSELRFKSRNSCLMANSRITGLKIFSAFKNKEEITFVIYAHGPLITVASHSDSSFQNTFQTAEDGSSVHGVITLDGDDKKSHFFLIFAADQAAVVQIELDFAEKTVSLKRKCDFKTDRHWILSAKKLSPSCGEPESTIFRKSKKLLVAISTTLNTQLWQIRTETIWTATLIGSKTPNINSLAKSSALFGKCIRCLRVACGTSFDHFYCYKYSSNGENAFDTHFLALSEKANAISVRQKGAIFDIDWSPNGKMLCTVSDDRCVRIWNLDENGESPEIKELSLGFGHKVVKFKAQSRVLKCKWIDDARLVSAGEDGFCCLWKLTFAGCGPLLRKTLSLRCHPSQIWSVDYKKGVLATGGEDSAVKTWRLLEFEKNFSGANEKIKFELRKSDYVKRILCLKNGTVVVGSNNGFLFAKTETETILLKNFESAVTDLFEETNAIFVALKNGQIFVFQLAENGTDKKFLRIRTSFGIKGIGFIFVKKIEKETVILAVPPKSQKLEMILVENENFCLKQRAKFCADVFKKVKFSCCNLSVLKKFYRFYKIYNNSNI